MSAISTILTRLRAAIWAIDVRDDIANAIEQCYSDVSNPTLQTEALEAALQNKIDQGEMAALTIGDRTITAVKLANGVIPAADATLTTSGGYADAAETGRQIGNIRADLGDFEAAGGADKYFTNVKVYGEPLRVGIGNIRNNYNSQTGFILFKANADGTPISGGSIKNVSDASVSGHFRHVSGDGHVYEFDYDLSSLPSGTRETTNDTAHVIKQDRFYDLSRLQQINYIHPLYPGGIVVDEFGNIIFVNEDFNQYEANPLKGKSVSILGDSISSYEGRIPEDYAYYYPRGDVDDVSKTWWGKLINDTGMLICNNASWSGGTVAGEQLTNAKCGCSQLRVDALKNPSTNADPDIILCYVSTNDWGKNIPIGDFGSNDLPDLTSSEITTIAMGYAVMLYRIRNTYPNAIVYCITSLAGRHLSSDLVWPFENEIHETLHQVNEKITYVAHLFGARVIDLETCGIHQWNITNYTVDTHIHPNDAGARVIADTVKRRLEEDFR